MEIQSGCKDKGIKKLGVCGKYKFLYVQKCQEKYVYYPTLWWDYKV